MEQDTEQKISYHLEMLSRDDLRPSERTATEFEIKRVEIACPEFNWFLHHAVGADFRWGGREKWGRQEWTEYVDRPQLETWVAYVKGTPAGYYELEKQEDGSVRIECFGLRRLFFGQGLGGGLLTKAIERCWEMDASRVWLSTCSHDHAHALQNYLARGFKLVNETTGPPNSPRESALFAPPSKP
jgi:GNAT superfamily N-acetyltransferase